MPLRRVPTEPSPRVLALLERGRSPGPDPLPREWVPQREGLVGPGRHRPPPPPVLALPSTLQRVRAGVSRPAVMGFAALVVLAALAFGVRVVWAQRAASPQVVAPGAAGIQGVGPVSVVERTGAPVGTADGSAPSTDGPGGPSAGGQVTVHVVGEVRRPGIVRLPAGSRVADAVRRAGGATRGADLAALNLARLVVDGEQIRVPEPGEVPLGGLPSVGGGQGGGPSSGSAGAAGSLVNLNTADLATLESLPGVGPVLAQRILEWRTTNGRFTAVDELNEVTGIGEKLMAQIAPKVTV